LDTKDTSQSITSLQLEKKLEGFSLIIAPSLLAASSFFWRNGEYGVEGATMLILSLFCWIPALKCLFAFVEKKMPRYSILGYWIAVFGCISGVCFAFLGYLATIFNISHTEYLLELNSYPVTSQILLFGSGPLFPLSVLILGLMLIVNKVISIWIALLLCVGAILFPVSRILRVEWLAHIADIIFFIPCCSVAIEMLRREKRQVD